MKPIGHLATAALLAGIVTTGGASAATAAPAEGEPVITWDSSSFTSEYGAYWSLGAKATNMFFVQEPWLVTGTLSGTPSGYAPNIGYYDSLPFEKVVYIMPQVSGRPLPAGTYTGTITVTASNGAGESYTSAPVSLTISPAALTATLQVIADPSNPENAIISGDLTGPFRDSFYTTSFAEGPLSPAGTWRISVTDESGQVVHEFEKDRAETDDILGVSTYWPGVAPGQYTVRATFTPSGGASAQNFTITQAAPVTYTAAPAPGATSTATPAPPAPPPAEAGTGLVLPAWIPLAAGILTAGLVALMIVQIVRLRRTGAPSTPAQGSEAS